MFNNACPMSTKHFVLVTGLDRQCVICVTVYVTDCFSYSGMAQL